MLAGSTSGTELVHSCTQQPCTLWRARGWGAIASRAMGTPQTTAAAPSFQSATPSAVLAFPHSRGRHRPRVLQPALPARQRAPAHFLAEPEAHKAAGNGRWASSPSTDGQRATQHARRQQGQEVKLGGQCAAEPQAQRLPSGG